MHGPHKCPNASVIPLSPNPPRNLNLSVCLVGLNGGTSILPSCSLSLCLLAYVFVADDASGAGGAQELDALVCPVLGLPSWPHNQTPEASQHPMFRHRPNWYPIVCRGGDSAKDQLRGGGEIAWIVWEL